MPRRLALHWFQLIQLVPTRDGREVLVARFNADANRMDLVAFSTAATTPSEGRVLGPGKPWDLTPDGTGVIITVRIDERVNLAVVPVAGGAPRVLTPLAESPRDVRMGADGRVHFAVRVDSRFVASSVPLAGGAVAQDAATPITLVVPLPDGRTLVEDGASDVVRSLRIVPAGAALDDRASPSLRVEAFVITARSSRIVRPTAGRSIASTQPAATRRSRSRPPAASSPSPPMGAPSTRRA